MFVELDCDTYRSKRSWVLATARCCSSGTSFDGRVFELLDLLADHAGIDDDRCFIP